MSRLGISAKIILCFSLAITSFSCVQGRIDPFDRATGLTRTEIKNTMIKNRKSDELKKSEKSVKTEAPIPAVSKLIMTPPPPAIGSNKIISFSVTEQVPLKDVLIELGRVAKIDIDLDPEISGGIILNAKNRPLKEVIDRIATLGKLRYSYKNGVLHFERDAPYLKNYFVDYLSSGFLWSDVEANISAILALDGGASASTATAEGEESASASSSSGSSFSSNKSAGIISLFATEKQHAEVAKYLAIVEKHASAQVLIEAKVVEVTLTDTFKSGIDWTVYGKKNTLSSSNSYSSGSAFSFVAGRGALGMDMAASISALETFGTSKTLSSPRIHAMNNQKAVLNFTDKLVYFKVDASQTQTTGQSGNVVTTVTSSKLEENVGVQLSITPSINLETNEINMEINPKLSVKSSTVVDPASPKDKDGKVIADLVNTVPVIQTRDLSTVAKIQSGDVIVIGGLMKETTTNTDSGIPLLNRIPILGWFFKSVSKSSEVVETVIFIKATIVNSGKSVLKEDREFQEKLDPSKRRYFSN